MKNIISSDKRGILSKVFLLQSKKNHGAYIWGGVGRGKSFLVDEFFHLIPIRFKQRLHFLHFMEAVHQDLKKWQGRKNPLRLLANDWAKTTQLLCLDEFQVSDIADAMIMRTLLEELFKQGVVIVTTSNTIPDRLYEHGLQREQFIPAIELIKSKMSVLELDHGKDYRLVTLSTMGVYHYPLGKDSDEKMLKTFNRLAKGEVSEEPLDLKNRHVKVLKMGNGVGWFLFKELCEGPRGSSDYIILSKIFHTVLLSEVPTFGKDDSDRRRRFTWLVDEFYDQKVNLILSANAPIEKLLSNSLKNNEVLRTESRLIEMQSKKYLGYRHGWSQKK